MFIQWDCNIEGHGIVVLELNLKLVGHIFFQFNYLKFKIWAGVCYKDCSMVLGHSTAIFGYFNVVLGDSTTIFAYFTHQCIFYLNDEVMEEVWLELVSSGASLHDTHFFCAHFQEIVLVLFLICQQF
jgi:hypothetical protein